LIAPLALMELPRGSLGHDVHLEAIDRLLGS
jgi:hypothetical protein